MLHGRDVERARLAGVLRDARAGRAGTLLVHGEPGAGKSALLDYLVANAGTDVCILRTQGVESEAPLAFAALHRLLRPVIGLLDRLPAPQARCLRIAFGLESEPQPGGRDTVNLQPFLVALGTLSMLTEAAEASTVLCLVDDAQWLDQATADALLIAARRLGADRVVVVFAARDGEGRAFTPDGVPSMALPPLTGDAARAVLTEAVGDAAADGVIADDVVDRLVGQAAGNALALVELPTTLSRDQLRGTAPLPAQPHVTARMERVFLDRCRRLPGSVQTLVLVVAADDSGRVATVRRAAALLGVDDRAFDAAERSGLVVVRDDRLRVRHPLVRSAVYQAATSGERRRVHRAIADVLDPRVEADRHAWHRAASVDGPDPAVVAALDATAARAEHRGGYAAAAAAHARAADLTDAEPARAARLFAAARNAWAAGQTPTARTLVAAAREHARDTVLWADIERLRGRIDVNVGSAVDAHRTFTMTARGVAQIDPVRALELAVAAALLRTYGADSGTTYDVQALAAGALTGDSAHRRCLGHLLLSLTRAAGRDWPGARAALQSALGEGAALDDPDVLAHLGNAALHLGDDEAHQRCFTRMLAGARDAGAVMLVLYALPRLGFTQLSNGRWVDLRRDAEEAVSLSAGIGQRALGAVPLGLLTVLAASQGRPGTELDELLAALDAAARQPLGVLADPVHDLGRWARAARAAHGGDAKTALHHLAGIRLSTLGRLAALDRIEAAVHAGDHQQASAWIDDLAGFAAGTAPPWARAIVEHGRALLSAPGDTADLFDSALAHHAGAYHPYEQARTHLAYGEWLRRAQRRVDARTHLRAALRTFEDLRAEPLAARAAQELRASGETARKRDASTLLHLTPMERQVAELARQGLSNKDIAAQCWVSHRTVAFHLRNIFAKAGVASRGELAQLDLA